LASGAAFAGAYLAAAILGGVAVLLAADIVKDTGAAMHVIRQGVLASGLFVESSAAASAPRPQERPEPVQ
jgi:hypothetical protein